jgi:hypothetical protein
LGEKTETQNKAFIEMELNILTVFNFGKTTETHAYVSKRKAIHTDGASTPSTKEQ